MANDFEQKTLDTRPLFFTHPFKGRIKCQLLSLERNDRVTTGANETSFMVALHQTIDISIPTSNVSIERQIDTINLTKEESNADAFNDFDDVFDTQNNLFAGVQYLQEIFTKYFSVSLDVLAEFEQIRLTAINAISTIQTNAKLTAFAVQRLIAFPSKIVSSLSSKLSFFKELVAYGNGEDEFGNRNFSDFEGFQLFQSSVLIGYARVAISSSNYRNRKEVFGVFDDILSSYDSYITFSDMYSQDYDVKNSLDTIIPLSLGNMYEIALASRQERKITLTSKTDIWMLAYSLYSPRIPENLDNLVLSLINNNNFLGDEIFELQIGREIVYYL